VSDFRRTTIVAGSAPDADPVAAADELLSSTQRASGDIRAALKHAESKGWTIRKSGPRAHAWGVIYCPYGHESCWMSVYSTPKNPEIHARSIRKQVDRCPGS